MAQNQFVVKINESTDLYLKTYCPVFENCQWAGPEDAITWETLDQAETVASLIGSGTVGTTKPR